MTRDVVRLLTRQMARIEPRFKEIEHTPGPGDYETSSIRSHSPSASITSARRTLDKKELTPGPSNYSPHPLLNKPKKLTIRLPRRVRIDLTPGVG